MFLKKKEINGVIVLSPQENLIGEIVEDLNNELEQYIDSKENKKFLFNLKNVSQIDSYSLSILATFGNEINARGGVVYFSNLQSFIFSIFRMMRMNDIFEVFDDEKDALGKLNE